MGYHEYDHQGLMIRGVEKPHTTLLKPEIDHDKILEVWPKASQQPMSISSSHHTDDTPSTSDSMVKSRKGKFRYPCLLCKDMHLTYLCPRMDEASQLSEDIIFPQKWLPTSYIIYPLTSHWLMKWLIQFHPR